jgi:hypothetical protein
MAGFSPVYVLNDKLPVKLLQDKFTLTELGYEPTSQTTLTVSNTTASSQLTQNEYVRALITVENYPIRVWVTGELPTNAAGHLIEAGDQIVLNSPTQIKKFRAIGIGGPAVLQISFYRPYDSEAPEAVTGVAAQPGVRLVSLTWDASPATDLAGYNVYRNGSKVNDALITSTSYVMQNLTAGQTYIFQVTALDLYNNESLKSAAIEVVPLAPDLVPPGAPTNVLIDPIHAGLRVSWAISPELDLAGYNVYVNNAPVNQGLILIPTYDIEGLTIGQSYSVQITAVDTSDNESAKSAAVNGVPVDLTPPATPTNFSATAADRQVVLTWSANTEPNLAGYNVYRNGVKVTATPISALTYTSSGLTNGVEYSFQVAAVNTQGIESTKTAAVPRTPRDAVAPATPVSLAITPQDSGLVLTWSANTESDLAGYNVYRNNVKVNSTLVTNATYTMTGLTNGTQYSCQVSAVDTSGNESARTGAITGTPNDPSLLLYDDFNRTTTTDLGTADTGQAYTYYGTGGSWRCNNGSAAYVAVDAFEIGYAVVNFPGHNHGSIEAQFNSAPNAHLGLAFRMSADDVGLSVRPGTGGYALYKDAQTVVTTFPSTIADGDILKVTFINDDIIVHLNGVEIGRTKLSVYMTNTQHGLVSRSARSAAYLKIRNNS